MASSGLTTDVRPSGGGKPTKRRFTCSWIWDTAVVLCDGKVVCGCADPYGERPIGHLKKNSIREIWNNAVSRKMRQGLNEGYAPFCLNCGLKEFIDDDAPIAQRPVTMERVPRLFIEPTVVCNISCFQAVCNKENGIVGTRERKMMPLEEFKALVDDVGEELGRIDLFNYGDPFVHPKTVDMIEYVKSRYPHIFLYLSTNGILLDEKKIDRIVGSGLDEITFSIDGTEQDIYEKYRREGIFGRALGNMKLMVDMRNERGRMFPFVNWRYILFKWNSSDEQMQRAREMASEIGVNKLVWEITDHPEAAKSEKYQIGTEAWKKIYYEIWDTSQTCNALPDKRLLADIYPPDGPVRVRRSSPEVITVLARNTGGAIWHRAVPGFRRSVRLGAQLFDSDRRPIDINYARAFLPADVWGGETAAVDIELPPIEKPGDYMLRFDMSCEGIDWFDSGGSPVKWRELRVI
jgi:sulfatase maturation enzyme AslB (radical SAM superfamily)